MGKNLVAISEITSAKKAKYVTPSMMVVEGEMELCMLQNSQDPGQMNPGSQGGGTNQEEEGFPGVGANLRFSYDF